MPMVVDVNKRWSGCKRAVSLGKIMLCRGTRSSATQTLEARATQVLSSKGPAATGPFHDSLRYPLLLIFPPDRVEVPGNAGHIHREAQDFKKQVHRLHPNQRSERCPQADSAAVKILPHRPRWETFDPFLLKTRPKTGSSQSSLYRAGHQSTLAELRPCRMPCPRGRRRRLRWCRYRHPG